MFVPIYVCIVFKSILDLDTTLELFCCADTNSIDLFYLEIISPKRKNQQQLTKNQFCSIMVNLLGICRGRTGQTACESIATWYKVQDVESGENPADSHRNRVGPAGLHHSQTRSTAPSIGLRLRRDAAVQKCQTAEWDEKKEPVTNQSKENKMVSARATSSRSL